MLKNERKKSFSSWILSFQLSFLLLTAFVAVFLFVQGCNPPSATQCGNGTCDYNEDCLSCAADCGICDSSNCGNGTCDPGEATQSYAFYCPEDCPPICNDGRCDSRENYMDCPEDCAHSGSCGDGTCGLFESNDSCPGDCPLGTCGNQICESGEDSTCGDCVFREYCCFHPSGGFSCIRTTQNGDCASIAGCSAVDTCGVSTVASCGDDTCHPAEDDGSLFGGCPIDCLGHDCGDGQCDIGESKNTCPADCANVGICGNNRVDTGEACDDGNLISGDGCDATCHVEGNLCGNHHLDGIEQCDDGNNVDGDGCTSTCTREPGYKCTSGNCYTVCGDGITAGSEKCDDGNKIGGDGCSANCRLEVCGNGITDTGEQCDDGNTVTETSCYNNAAPPCDICSDTCQTVHLSPSTSVCNNDGNCDTGNGETPFNCPNDCTCPNGIVDFSKGENCDDGNLIIGDGCSSCAVEDGWECRNLVGQRSFCNRLCGNGTLDSGEACDDHNTVDGDGCDSNCTVTACGNGIQTSGEACDDGNTTDGDGCQADCTVANCGNGTTDPGEACDDGNTADGDGCDANCTVTACGNGIQTSGEACDDGNTNNHDSCKTNCTVNTCGDGAIKTGVEECDDGNINPNDGCSASCAIESGYSCTGEPSGCQSTACSTPDNNDTLATATNLGTAPLGNPLVTGSMCPGDSIDYYKIQTQTSADFVIRLTPKQSLPVNGFIQLGFHLSNGQLVDLDTVSFGDTSAELAVRFGYSQLPAGTYYISVDGNTVADNASIPYDLEIYALACNTTTFGSSAYLDTSAMNVSKSFCSGIDSFVFNVERDHSSIDISAKITSGTAIGLSPDGDEKFPLFSLPADFIKATLHEQGAFYGNYSATAVPRDTNGDTIPDEIHFTYNNAKAGNYILEISQDYTAHNTLTFVLNYELNGSVALGTTSWFQAEKTYTWNQVPGSCINQQPSGVTFVFNDFAGLDDIAGDGKLTVTMKGDTHSFGSFNEAGQFNVQIGYNVPNFGFQSYVTEQVSGYIIDPLRQRSIDCGEVSKSITIPESVLRDAIPTLPNGPGELIVKVTPSASVDCSCSENSITAVLEIPEVMVCGDGIIRHKFACNPGDIQGEGCDDGNTANGDGCSSTCDVESGWSCSGDPSACQNLAGNGQCDPGETPATVPADCPSNSCGNHLCEAGESSSNCFSDCSVYETCCEYLDNAGVCQNGISHVNSLAPSWACGGRTTCQTGLSSECGNGYCETGETLSSCPADCDANACGNGSVQVGEECDDGAKVNGDGCDAACNVESGYACTGEPSSCRTVCGNGVPTPDEACDDGNTDDGDGCSAACTVEPGFNCYGTYCVAICGNGDIQKYETCDDGNTIDGDGCSSYCQLEYSYCCTGEPSSCIDDGGTNSCGTCGDHVCNSYQEYSTCNQDCQ